MSIWVRSLCLDFEKIASALGHPYFRWPKADALASTIFFFFFFLCTNISLFHISHLDMFLQTQNTTRKTKSKNKVTMLSFYTAKLKKSNS